MDMHSCVDLEQLITISISTSMVELVCYRLARSISLYIYSLVLLSSAVVIAIVLNSLSLQEQGVLSGSCLSLLQAALRDLHAERNHFALVMLEAGWLWNLWRAVVAK